MQRKATKNTRGPNADEKRFHGWVKERPCAVCGLPGPSIVDHAEGATFKHNKTLVGHWFVVPLCEAHDKIKTRGSRRGFKDMFGPHSELWEKEIGAYLADSDMHSVPSDVHLAIIDWGR